MTTKEDLMGRFVEHLKSRGVPDRTANAANANALTVETPALQKVRAWWASGDSVIVLIGGNGCGKSVAAASISREHCHDNAAPEAGRGYIKDRGDMLPWWVWKNFLWRSAQDVFYASVDRESKENQWLSRAGLLVIDEAGAEDGDPERCVSRVIQERHGQTDKRTIVTSNSPIDDFKVRYGARVMSRIGESSIVKVHGPDLRKARR